MKSSQKDHQPEELTTEQQVRRRTLKAFAWFGLAALVPVGVWKWITGSPKEAGLRKPLRRVLGANERVFESTLRPGSRVPTFPKNKAARVARVNGSDGLRSPVELEGYKIRVEQPSRPPLDVSLAELRALPKQEIVFDLKCIEGWSQVQHWGGVSFADFVTHYGLPTHLDYVGMETPDQKYYVGLDTASALHPQTLLAYELNGQSLTDLRHGAPLRLIIPVKYGVKNLKRIGTIAFTNTRPRDFWAERGYDYFIGL